MAIDIELSERTKKLLRNAKAIPQLVLEGAANGMDRGHQSVIAYALPNHFRGKGPFPVAEHRVGIVTGRLWKSWSPSKSVIIGNEILSSIGSNVKYAGVHEHGVETTVRQSFKRTFRIGKRAVTAEEFARRVSRTRMKKKIALAQTRQRRIKIPARAPMNTAIQTRGPSLYRYHITRAVRERIDREVA